MTAEKPAAAGSALARLRDRRKAASERLHLDLAVPRYDPPIYVRFRPVTQPELESIERRFKGSKDPDKNVHRHAALLAETCVGIFERNDQGAEQGLDPDSPGVWPRFDDALAGLLEADVDTAVDTVRALYLTDGDVIATAGRVTEWSGYAAFEDDSGN